VITCKDRETRETVVASAAERASFHWNGSRKEFVDMIDPGLRYDWAREALGEPSGPDH
jgi:hypothetical protein